MEKEQPVLSLHTAKLIVKYTHNLISEEERDQLDQWLTESDDNLEIFETLIEDVHQNIFDADSIIIETEDLLEVWMIAGLITRKIQKMITPDQERQLNEWAEASERNKKLYEIFTNPAYLQKLAVWFRQSLRQGFSPDMN